MQSSKVHPLLLIGLLSMAASALLECLVCPGRPGGFMQGFLDGIAVACLFGYLLARRLGWLAQSR